MDLYSLFIKIYKNVSKDFEEIEESLQMKTN